MPIMIFQRPKISLPLSVVLLIITACSQPPNFAPVKTVNQAVEPDNGYVRDRRRIKPSNSLNKRQKKAKILHSERPAKVIRQNTATRAVDVGTLPHHLSQAQSKQPLPLTNPANKPVKNKTDYPDSGSYPVPVPQKSAKVEQKPAQQSKNKQVISNANEANTQKNQRNNTKSLDNLQITEKNIKKSIISIDNKKMLKLSFQWPLQGRVSRNFSQTDNKGILITGKTGQSVYAAESGKAVYCGQGLAGFGNLAIIKHNETYLSAYANNSKLMIKEGQYVGKGQAIGQVGRTGLKKASLHFEIRKNGKPINPLTVLPGH